MENARIVKPKLQEFGSKAIPLKIKIEMNE